MDGFGTDSGVIVVAALTDRIFRFGIVETRKIDRQISIDKPDINGEKQFSKSI